MSSIYCVYLTTYSGNKMPPFYIGYSTIKKVENGYRGTVKSKKYQNIWHQEIKENSHLFKTKIIATYQTQLEATNKEALLQTKLKVLHNPLYINQSIMYKCKTNYSHMRTDNPAKRPEVREKIRLSKLGPLNHYYGKLPKNTFQKGHISQNKGKSKSDHQKQIISKATKNAMWRPDIRQRFLDGMKKRSERHKLKTLARDNHREMVQGQRNF